jgi:hypothetical protein
VDEWAGMSPFLVNPLFANSSCEAENVLENLPSATSEYVKALHPEVEGLLVERKYQGRVRGNAIYAID